MDDTWEELDALCQELHSIDGGGSEERARLQSQLEALAPVLEVIERHRQELAPVEALVRLRERVLGGAGVIQHTSFEYGLEHLAVLAWPAAADPRPDRAGALGEYRIEVWLGVGEDGRPRVRVVGEKRMQAGLPVARDRFRAVLLGAVRAPAFVALPEGEAGPPPGEPSTEASTAEQPAAAPANHAPETPPQDTPIPMGPASATTGGETPDAESGAAPRSKKPPRRGPRQV